MERQDAREQLKGYLRNYVESVTQKSKGVNMFVCPLCGSGEGHNGTGAFSIKDGTSWKCFSCNKGGDIFDLIGEYEGIADHTEQLKRAGELFGITIDSYRSSAREDFSPAPAYQNQDKTEQYTHSNIHTNTYTQTRGAGKLNGNKDIKPMSWAKKGGYSMNREQKRRAIKAKTRTPAEQQITALMEYPCIMSWSNGERSKTTLSKAFYDEDSYKRYAEYQRSGKPYPVKIEAEAPTDPQGASSMFRGETAYTDYTLLDKMCRDFTTALQQYLSIDTATATIMQQAEEATRAMQDYIERGERRQ